MSKPSQWPLTPKAIRQITPGFILEHLRNNPLTRACYPTAFGYYPNAKSHHMQRDQHNDNLLIYCDQGLGHLRTKHHESTVIEGDVILLPSGTPHEYQASNESPWSIYWVHFDGLQANQLIKELDIDPQTSLGQQPLLASDFNRLMSLRHDGYRNDVFSYAAALTRQMLYFLALQNRSNKTPHRHNFSLEALRSLMLDNIHGELDLGSLAASTQLSKHHFAAKYKKLTGISPIKHFIHLKMERACYLLDSSNDSAKQVSALLGYNDPLYFSRIFKKIIGLSPSDYRKRLRV